MRVKFPNFIGASYTSQSPIASQERTMNFYTERIQVPGAKNSYVCYPSPGFSAYGTPAAQGPGRAAFALNGRVFSVQGGVLYEHFSNTTKTARGSVAYTDGYPAMIEGNGDAGGQLFIVSSNKGYCFDLTTNVLTEELSTGARMVAMLDGYFMVLDAENSALQVSPLNNGVGWDAHQVTFRSAAPDPWVALAVLRTSGLIFLIGTQTAEVWTDVGLLPFPFDKYPGGLLPVGTNAPFSLAQIGGSLFWLAQSPEGDGDVVQADGLNVRSISDYALQYAISQYTVTSDAEGWTYESQGHPFYVLRFPTAKATWAYDLSTQQWCERGSWNSTDLAFDAWRARCHAFGFGKHLVCDSQSGQLYQMDEALLAADLGGGLIRRIRRAPAINAQMNRVIYDSFELHLEAGLGLTSGQGSHPQVELRISDDGGKTFAIAGSASAGPVGDYRRRTEWRRLGQSVDRVFEVVMADPIPWRLIDAYLQVR